MIRKQIFLVMAAMAAISLPAFSQEEGLYRNEVTVQAFGSFLKSTDSNGVEQSATNSGGVLGSYRFFFNNNNGVEVDYGYSLNTQNYSFATGSIGVPSYSHEISAAYVFRHPLKRWTPFVLAGTGALLFDAHDTPGVGSQARATLVYGGGPNHRSDSATVFNQAVDLAVPGRIELLTGSPIRFLQLNNPSANSNGDGFGAVFSAQFFHDVPDMHFDGFFGNEQQLRDVPVAITAGHVSQHFNLARGKVLIAHVLGKMRRHLRRDLFLALVHLADDIHQLVGRHALQQVPACSRLKRPLNFNVAFKGCQHDDPRVREFRPDGDHSVNAAPIRQPEIHQRNIRPALRIPLEGFAATGRFSNQLHVRLVLNDGGDPFAEKRVIVDAQDANAILTGHGSFRFHACRSARRAHLARLECNPARNGQFNFSSKRDSGQNAKLRADSFSSLAHSLQTPVRVLSGMQLLRIDAAAIIAHHHA